VQQQPVTATAATKQSDEGALSPELRDRLLYYAGRAPSPHNAQGWRILEGEGVFRIVRDPDRQVLRAFDPAGRESDLACGAVVTNLCVTARAFGLDAEVRWRPATGLAAEVRLSPARNQPDEAAGARLRALRRRAVNRSQYLDDRVPQSLLDGITARAARLGFTLAVLTDRAAIRRVASVVAAAGTMKLAHRPTGAELYALTRFTARAAARERDGLDLELFFTPALKARVAALAMHPLAVAALEPLGMARMLARQAEELPLRSAPALCLLYADSLDEETFPRGGACFQEIALDVAETDLALSLHSAAVEVGLSHPDPPHDSLPAEWHTQITEVRRELRSAFLAPADSVPIAFFRIGRPTCQPERRSLRRQREEPRPESARYREMTRRNQPAVSDADQVALRATRVLVAGCGSIGGATVEPLVRLGVERFVLCEPGAYELNNLNRQSADEGDIGRNKAEVHAARARAINPQVDLLVDRDGVTAENVDWLVGTTDLVIDGVDVTEPAGIAAKRMLHEEAWCQRRLVISGLDLGGTQVVYAFDYRDGRTRPLNGRLDGMPTQLDALAFLSRLVSPLDLPRELLSYAEAMIRGEAGSPPQLAPTANQFGVLAAWMVLDFAAGRRLRRHVRVAIPDLVMTRRRRVHNEAARVAQLARVRLMLESTRRRTSTRPQLPGPGAEPAGSRS
jgi:hypothetical protein